MEYSWMVKCGGRHVRRRTVNAVWAFIRRMLQWAHEVEVWYGHSHMATFTSTGFRDGEDADSHPEAERELAESYDRVVCGLPV